MRAEVCPDDRVRAACAQKCVLATFRASFGADYVGESHICACAA